MYCHLSADKLTIKPFTEMYIIFCDLYPKFNNHTLKIIYLFNEASVARLNSIDMPISFPVMFSAVSRRILLCSIAICSLRLNLWRFCKNYRIWNFVSLIFLNINVVFVGNIWCNYLNLLLQKIVSRHFHQFHYLDQCITVVSN